VEEREAQMGARLRRVAAGERVVGMVRVPQILERALEAFSSGLELAAVEVRDPPAVVAVPSPGQQRRKEFQALLLSLTAQLSRAAVRPPDAPPP